jgi:hypothetical protein
LTWVWLPRDDQAIQRSFDGAAQAGMFHRAHCQVIGDGDAVKAPLIAKEAADDPFRSRHGDPGIGSSQCHMRQHDGDTPNAEHRLKWHPVRSLKFRLSGIERGAEQVRIHRNPAQPREVLGRRRYAGIEQAP